MRADAIVALTLFAVEHNKLLAVLLYYVGKPPSVRACMRGRHYPPVRVKLSNQGFRGALDLRQGRRGAGRQHQE